MIIHLVHMLIFGLPHTVTLSTAAGITELAPSSVTHKEILKAIGADVDHVIKHIAEARQRKIDSSAA